MKSSNKITHRDEILNFIKQKINFKNGFEIVFGHVNHDFYEHEGVYKYTCNAKNPKIAYPINIENMGFDTLMFFKNLITNTYGKP